MNYIEIAKAISQRRERLKEIKAELKREFFGLDPVIDRIIKSVETWYLLPDAVSFPVIINLWGLTGVGKTDLVRKLVRKLGFENKFVEIQMDGASSGSGFYQDSICEILETSTIDEGEACIILLDEFQRFRTIELNERGECKELDIKRYQDVWMLLSDGKFASDFSLYTKIQRELLNDAYNIDRRESDDYEDEPEEVVASAKASGKRKNKKKTADYIRKFGLSPWQAMDYKKLLKRKEPVAEIMTWDLQKINYLCQEALANRISTEFNYSKCLIFICGNLDEAFKMASSALEDCDTDADIFHEQTKKLSVVDIKKALQERFRPEQIARMGNNHIIYPSLSRKSYEQIIEATSQRYARKMNETIGVSFIYNNSVYDEIYANAVYPTQGTRPVFSSVHQILSSPLIDLSTWAVEKNISDITVSIDGERGLLIGTSGTHSLNIPILLDIRNQRARNTQDFNTLVAVHEAGHALVYAVLNNCTPKEIKINMASFKGGFTTFDEEELRNKQMLENMIAVCLGGPVAEEIVFGDAYRTNGGASDITTATEIAAKNIKYWCFDTNAAQVRVPSGTEWAALNVENYNDKIELLVKTQKENAATVIRHYVELFKLIVARLLKNDVIKAEDFAEMAKPFLPDIKISQEESISPYSKIWTEFELS